MNKIVMIGAGNVATHLSKALAGAGMDISQVYSRTAEHAAQLAKHVGADYTDDIDCLLTDAYAYIFAVKDDVIATLAKAVADRVGDNHLFVHTSGSTPMTCLKEATKHYGVIYPLQTFSKDREVNFKEIPCFIEAVDEDAEGMVRMLAESVSDRVVAMCSEQRRLMHLAAVWSCNFVNHCYDVADGIMQACDLPFELLLPLIDETARKVHELSPRKAQTGPAVRYDRRIIDAHLGLLAGQPQLADIYERMSKSIKEQSEKSE